MKLLRCFFALTLVCAVSGIAKADPIDFHMVVVDPGFTTNDLTTTSTTVQFSACDSGQLPQGITGGYVGCETFENETGADITSLELVFPDIGVLTTQSANCTAAAGVPNFFGSATCGLVGNNFVLYYSDGTIPQGFPNGIFTIAESGVDPTDFPTGTLTINVAPEPSSILLLSTGALMLGTFLYSKRRKGLGEVGL